MARYTKVYVVKVNQSLLRDLITKLLVECNLTVSYVARDYIMAQEKSGQVSFSKLVTVEVLIHQPELDSVKFTCVVKNEELPLNLGNHCKALAEKVNAAFETNPAWQMLESVGG